MKRLGVGILIATVVVYMWGFLFWGASLIPYGAWTATADDVAAGHGLLEHFPQRGTYFVPGMHHDPEALEALYAEGPIAMVHMLDTDGRPVFEVSFMVKGIFLNLVVVVLVALLLRSAIGGLPTYGSRVKHAALAGLIGAVLIHGGALAWWYMPLGWELVLAAYDFTAVVVIGLVLAKFVEPKAA